METYVIGLYFVCVENNNGMNLEQGPLLYASVRSRRRRIVLEEKRGKKGLRQLPSCREGSREWTHLRTVAAAVVDTVHAPPAMDFLHAEHFQIPTA